MAFAHARPPSADVVSSPAGAPKAGSVCPPDHRRGQNDSRGHAIDESKPAPACPVVRLKRRADFLAVAATGRRWIAPAFVLQVGPRSPEADADRPAIGLGFTATRRLGNAVARNRAKRRLREAARLVLPDAAVGGHDYVLVARSEVLTCAFQTLLNDLGKAFERVLTAKPRPQQARKASKMSRSPENRSRSGS